MSILLLVMQIRLWLGDDSIRDVLELRQIVEQQRGQNSQIKQRNAVLAAEVDDLKTGLEAIEEHARSELGMIRQDETFIQIIQ